jgi:hypothetical protein
MIVAVITMGVVQLAIDQIVDVIAMWHSLVAAIRAVGVPGIVTRSEVGCAVRRVGLVHGEAVLIDVIAVGMVQTAVVKIVGVSVVPDRRVAAIRPVFVGVAFVDLMSHEPPPADEIGTGLTVQEMYGQLVGGAIATPRRPGIRWAPAVLQPISSRR